MSRILKIKNIIKILLKKWKIIIVDKYDKVECIYDNYNHIDNNSYYHRKYYNEDYQNQNQNHNHNLYFNLNNMMKQTETLIRQIINLKQIYTKNLKLIIIIHIK